MEENPLFEPFSVREKAEIPGLYVLDPIPAPFRAQLVHILNRLIGTPVRDLSQPRLRGVRQPTDLWTDIAGDIAEALGRLSITQGHATPASAVAGLITSVHATSTLDVLDVIEVVLVRCRSWEHSAHTVESDVASRLDRARSEINQRFRQHHLAYRVQDDIVIRIDSQYVHQEVTAKAFRLLHSEEFAGAMDEFEAAHRHYLDGEYRQAIGSSHSAFESTLKTICDRKGWNYDRDRDGAKRLIDIVLRERQLIPELLLPSFKKYLEALEVGLPKLGNRQGRHGQGSVPESPPEHLVGYALNLTASNLVLLIEAFHSSL